MEPRPLEVCGNVDLHAVSLQSSYDPTIHILLHVQRKVDMLHYTEEQRREKRVHVSLSKLDINQ
jgi:plasmid maintenance system antidote protein VapI